MNGEGDDEVQSGEADFRERVSPHELTGPKRVQWMTSLWQAFSDVAVRGTISLADAVTIAEALHVDGEEHFLEEHLHDVKEVTFKQLTQVLDDMSRASGNEYRDIDVDKAVSDEQGQVEHLGPIDYIRYLCGSKDFDESDAHVTGATIKYKLRLMPSEFTPKQVLILTTLSLLLSISAIVITGMMVMWHFTLDDAVRSNMGTIHQGLVTCITTLETALTRQHAEGILATATFIASWFEAVVPSDIQLKLWTNELAVEREALLVMTGVSDVAGLQNAQIVGRTSLASELVALGISSTDPALLLGWVGATVASLQRSASDPACTTPLAVMLANNTVACLSYGASQASQSDFATSIVAAVDDINDGVEFSTFQNGVSLTSHQGQCVVPPDSTSIDYCTEFGKSVQASVDNGTNNGIFVGTAGQTFLSGIATDSPTNTLYVYSTLYTDLLANKRRRLIDVVNYLNFEFVRTTEIVIATRDPLTRVITRQATEYRFAEACLQPCARTDPASVNILAAFSTEGNGWSITPDYRPQAVIGGYAYVNSGLDIALVLERDLIEVRAISFEVIQNILRDVNAQLGGDIVTELIAYSDVPITKVYPAYTDCPGNTDCLIDPKGTKNVNGSVGIYFRYDCRHCKQIPQTRFVGTNPIDELCTSKDTSACNAPTLFAQETLRDQNTNSRITTEDRNGGTSYVLSAFITNYSAAAGLIAAQSRSVDLNQSTLVAVALGAVAIMIVGLIALIGTSMSSFSALEAEWSGYKDQLQHEKAKFGMLVKGLIPPSIAERLAGTSKPIADHVSTAAFVFVDVCQFSEITRTWSARYVARHMTYIVSLLETIATFCDVLKLRSIGDLVVVVALRDEKHRPDLEFHPCRRGMQFASITMLLFSKLYTHRPQTSKAFREVFKDKLRDSGALEMPSIRIGVHCGPTISGAFSISKTSHYDFFGPGPALANRMQQTALPNRIHVTVMVKEMLRTRDPNMKYQFENSRKTVVRGHGTITSYFVRAVTENIPYELIRSHGIDYARLRYDFAKGAKTRQHVVGDSESVVSSGSDK